MTAASLGETLRRSPIALSYAFRMKLRPEEQQAVATTLAVLPDSHPARRAAEQGADPIVLIALVERDDLAEALERIWFSAYGKRVASHAVR